MTTTSILCPVTAITRFSDLQPVLINNMTEYANQSRISNYATHIMQIHRLALKLKSAAEQHWFYISLFIIFSLFISHTLYFCTKPFWYLMVFHVRMCH